MVSPSRPKGTAGGKRGPLGTATWGALALIAAGALIGLTACGGTVAGSAAHPASAGTSGSTGPAPAVTASAGVPLCAAAGKVDRVVAIPGAATSAHSSRAASRSGTLPGFASWPPRSARFRPCDQGCTARPPPAGRSG